MLRAYIARLGSRPVRLMPVMRRGDFWVWAASDGAGELGIVVHKSRDEWRPSNPGKGSADKRLARCSLDGLVAYPVSLSEGVLTDIVAAERVSVPHSRCRTRTFEALLLKAQQLKVGTPRNRAVRWDDVKSAMETEGATDDDIRGALRFAGWRPHGRGWQYDAGR